MDIDRKMAVLALAVCAGFWDSCLAQSNQANGHAFIHVHADANALGGTPPWGNALVAIGTGVGFVTPPAGLVQPGPVAGSYSLGAGNYLLSLDVAASGLAVVPGGAGSIVDIGVQIDFGGSVPQFVTAGSPSDISRFRINHALWVSGTYIAGQSPYPGPAITLPLTDFAADAISSPNGDCFWAVRSNVFVASNLLHADLRAVALASKFSLNAASSVGYSVNLAFSLTESRTVTFLGTLDVARGGDEQRFPLMPTGPLHDQFLGAPTGLWYDPPLAVGYDFQQLGSSLFTDILELPVGVDGDGAFEVQVDGQSIGWFSEGSRVNFVQLLGHGVASFRIVGIDPAKDVGDLDAFPVKLAFNTPTSDFSMRPVTWRAIGTACSDPVCTACPSVSLSPVGDAVAGNSSFGVSLQNVPANSGALWAVGIGSAAPSPVPLHCGDVYLPQPWIPLVITFLPGTSGCDAGGVLPFPLPTGPTVAGTFLTLQVGTQCPEGGIGLTQAIEFAVGS